MNIDPRETHGRRLLVEFKCRRCKAVAVRPLVDCLADEHTSASHLYDLSPPKEWRDGGFYYPMFCPKCAEAYDRFMEGGGK